MAIDRIANWQRFSKHMEAYIREHTVEKYTAARDLCMQQDNAFGVKMNNQKYFFWTIIYF